MEFSKPLRRRLGLFAVSFALVLASTAIVHRASREHAVLVDELIEIARAAREENSDLHMLVELIKLCESAVLQRIAEGDPPAVASCVDEGVRAQRVFSEGSREGAFEDGAFEPAQPPFALDIEALPESAEHGHASLREPFPPWMAEVSGSFAAAGGIEDPALDAARQRIVGQSSSIRLGLLMGLLGATAGLLGGGLVFGEILNDALAARDLQAELDEIAQREEVQGRLELIARAQGLGPRETPAVWTLRLERVLSERRTHVVFEASATSRADRVLLWGRRYHWIGILKSLQRLPFAFASDRAAWSALRAMWAGGLRAPIPVALIRLRERRVPVGSILLAEHVGALRSVRSFVRGGFALLPPHARGAFVRRLGEFIRDLHRVGVVGISVRGLKGTGLDGSEPRFVLGELDKAHPVPGGMRAWHAVLRRADLRRVVRALEAHLSPSELQTLRRAMDPSPVPPRSSSV